MKQYLDICICLSLSVWYNTELIILTFRYVCSITFKINVVIIFRNMSLFCCGVMVLFLSILVYKNNVIMIGAFLLQNFLIFSDYPAWVNYGLKEKVVKISHLEWLTIINYWDLSMKSVHKNKSGTTRLYDRTSKIGCSFKPTHCEIFNNTI